MDIKYLKTGEKVSLIQKLDDGKYLIQDIFYAEYYDEMRGDCEEEIVKDCCRIVDYVYDVPPRSVFDDRIKQKKELIVSLEERDKKLRQAINDSEKEYKEMKERFKKYEELKLLDDYLEGRITHLVDLDSYRPRIITIAETKCKCDKRDPHPMILSLVGDFRSKNKIIWNFQEYCRQVSSSDTRQVIPCTSLEMAKSKLLAYINNSLSKINLNHMAEGKIYNVYKFCEVCLEYKLEIDDKYMVVYHQEEETRRQRQEESTRDKIACLEKELAELKK